MSDSFATLWTAARQAPLSMGFPRQEYWSELPFPSPMQESEKWKWIRSVVPDSSQPQGLQPTRLLHPWDFPGKSTGGHQMFKKKFFFCLLLFLNFSGGFHGYSRQPTEVLWGGVHPKKVVGFQPYFLKVGAGPHIPCLTCITQQLSWQETPTRRQQQAQGQSRGAEAGRLPWEQGLTSPASPVGPEAQECYLCLNAGREQTGLCRWAGDHMQRVSSGDRIPGQVVKVTQP